MKKILIIDDNPNLILYIEKQLRDAGHEVKSESTGLAAIERLVDYTPDIVFIDYFLPTINGDILCQIIRSMDRLKHAYLVLMSAAAKELRIDPSAVGADALMAKGAFKETAAHFFSAIADVDKPRSRGQEASVIGIESVLPRRMTIELLEKYRHLQTMLDSISEGIVEIYQGRIVYANPAAVVILGKPLHALFATAPPDLFTEAERAKVHSMLEGGNAGTPADRIAPVRLNDRVLSMRKLSLQGEPDTVILLITDITEQADTEEALRNYQGHLEALVEERTADLRRASEQLHKAQKMETIGIMAGRVAHDLNNVLAGILAYPDLLLLKLPPDSPLRKIAFSIQQSGKKAAAIVRDLLTMARRGAATHEVVNLNTVVTEYFNSPEYTKLASFHPQVEVAVDLSAATPNILGSFVHLSESVMNLVSNAAEAIPEGGKVVVTTEKRSVSAGAGAVVGDEEISPGDYVVLSIADTGVGISPEDIERIFEPFYTKKVMGRSGTGLGLSVVWGTVKDHGGYIDVRSAPGKGTRFELFFPLTTEEATRKEPAGPISEYRAKGESILVVDDEEEQRQIAASVLTMLGYSVSTVSGGEEAVEYVKEHTVDVIILDMVMDPGIDGLETYKRIHTVRPGQKAGIVSGTPGTERISEGLRLGVGRYIRKPYTMERIGLALRQELDKKR
jgi:signal transduction histidine kinase/DNA-binding response OmpR family regulator